jgi:cyclophilin family peptidyl-prolyl cis-trans isomerase
MKMTTRWLLTVLAAGSMATTAVAQPKDAPKTDPKTDAPKATPPETPKDEAKQEYVYILFKTGKGEIVLELNNAKAPISTANFVKYVEKGHYDGTIFHRTIPNFMVQGGGMTADRKEKATDSPIRNEWKNGLKNKRGTLAMARTADPNSATSQFFINVVDNDFLDQPSGGAAYAVFGQVIAGMDVVDAIVKEPTRPNANAFGEQSDPINPVVVEKASKLTKEEADAKKAAAAPKDDKKPEEKKPTEKK